MRLAALLAVAVITVVALFGCTAGQVDDTLLPTQVPTIDAQQLVQLAIAARPTPFPTPTDTPSPTQEPTTSLESVAEATPEPVVIQYGDDAVETIPSDSNEQPEAQEDAVAAEEETAAEDDAALVDPEETAPAQDDSAVAPETEADAATASDSAADGDAPDADAIDDAVSDDAVPDRDATDASDEGDASGTVEASDEVGSASMDVSEGDAADEQPEVAEESVEAVAEIDPQLAGLPESLIELMADADPYNGETLTLSLGCTGCHNLDPNAMMAGPTFYDLANTAATRIEGESAGLYLYNSIVDPNVYIVEGYIPNLMIANFKDTVSEEDLADILAYLLTIEGR